ncbi:S8 family serine peptidase [Legionella spiritensis]|uniref:S8 family serine peptidase n=1 Tax=Legionella spiritensis TaxID=452 RepID=UPI000F71A4C2|nr:S8 family serine peptidase [Legionella spiritensis]VEG92300.1 AprE, Subtilisin-like serine protease [Legionella spiritensis]
MRGKSGLIGLAILSLAQGVMAAEFNKDIHVIVKFKKTTALLNAKQQLAHTIAVAPKTMQPMAGGFYTMTFSSQGVSKSLMKGQDATDWVVKQLRQNPAVQYAVKDRVGHFKPLPNPSQDDLLPPLSHELQWDEFSAPAGVMLESAPGLRDGAWAYTSGQASKPIVVAVLDTGVAFHPALADNLLKDESGAVWGWNFAGNNRDLRDETLSYHGTHVAGTIAAYSDVMSGVGEHLKILPIKVPDGSGMFYESQVINAIYWAVGGHVPGVPENPYPAKVLNMSFGVDERPGKEIDHCDEALQDALWFARKKGAVVAAAAGNDNRWEHYNAPAVCNGTMKVASTGPEGLRAYYSNYGPGVAYAAPGGDARYGKQGAILSTVNPGGGYQGSGYDFYQGTSMASPHAAGIAGLIYAVRDGDVSPEKVEQIMYATTHGFGISTDPNKSCVGNKPCGHGILDANNAVKAAVANYDVFFSAPTIDALKLTSCASHAFLAQENMTSSQGATWKRTGDATCQQETSYQQGYLTQEKDGNILAHYGEATYQLDTSLFRHCQVVGFDGVGCYR